MTTPTEPRRHDDRTTREEQPTGGDPVDEPADARADDGVAPLIANTGDDDDGAPTG